MTPTFNAKFTFGPPLQVLERPAAGGLIHPIGGGHAAV